MSTSPLHSGFALSRLREGLKPFRLCWRTTLKSTNDFAAAMRKRGELFAPSIVLCGEQTAGRGRGKNTWWSNSGVLTVTFVLPAEGQAPDQLPLLAGLAVRSAVARMCGIDGFMLKWPNDILFGERKVAGLLCERVDKVDLVGVGLNVNLATKQFPKALANRMTSLSHITGRSLDMTSVVVELARELRQVLERSRDQTFTMMLKEYDRHHALVGRKVRVIGHESEAPVMGVCEGLDGEGRLRVRQHGKIVRLVAGEVQT